MSLLAPIVLLVAVVWVGCGEAGSPPEGEGEGEGEAGPVAVDFVKDGEVVDTVDLGAVDGGGSVEVDLLLTPADGTSVVDILSEPPVLVGGRDADSFVVVTQPTLPIRPAGSPLRIRFAPTVGGEVLGKLIVAYGVRAEQRTLLDLRGTSTAPPRAPGLRTFIYDGSFDLLPDFDTLTPATTTTSATVTIVDRAGGDFFAYRFVGAIDVDAAGTYEFFSRSDDGSRVIVDGDVVVDNDGLHGPVDVGGSVELAAGSHDFEVQFFENAGGEVLDVQWSGPGFAREAIPADVLFDAR